LPVFSTGNEKKGITVFSGRDPERKQGNGARFGLVFPRGSGPLGPRGIFGGDAVPADRREGRARISGCDIPITKVVTFFLKRIYYSRIT